jgi:flagellar basal body-associated protein FliL
MTSTDNNEKKDTTDNKKNKKPLTLGQQISKFSTSLFTIICVIVIYFIFGGLLLYGCKIAQSNVLPTDIESYPYNDARPNIQPITTNIFRTYTEPPLSMKLSIPYNNENSKNTIIDILRKYKYEAYSSSTGNFFVSLLEGLLSFNYSSMNLMLNLLNYLPELLILLFGPIIACSFTTLIFLLDHFYLIYLWFANLGWFFKQNVNDNPEHKPVWENVSLFEPVNFCISIAMVILFLCLFWFLLATIPFLPLFTMSWTLVSLLGYEGTMNSKEVGASTIVKYTFKYYKVLFMTIISFFVIINTFGIFGTIPGVFCLLTLVLIIFGILSIDIFKASPEINLSALVTNEQAKKTRSSNNPAKKKHGLLYDLLFPQAGGKTLMKEIKTAGNILSSGKK